MLNIINPEWRNGNEHIRYPFIDTATLTSTEGNELDQDVFLDARLYPIDASAGLYISALTVTDQSLTVTVSSVDHIAIASGSFQFADPTPDEIVILDIYRRPAGVLVSTAAKLDNLRAALPVGETKFLREATEFVPSVVSPMPQICLRGLLLDDGSMSTGELILVGTDGILLWWDEGEGAIVVDMVGDPYALLKVCLGEIGDAPVFCGLRTINGIAPDANGDFKLTVASNVASENIIRVNQDIDGAIRISAVGFGGGSV